MLKFVSAVWFAVLPLLCIMVTAHAADVIEPVKAVMEASVANLAGTNSGWQNVFDKSRLKTLYSKDLMAKYRAAAQFSSEDDGNSPFDYVIVDSPDACPLQDLHVAPRATSGCTKEVIVSFKQLCCAGSDAGDPTLATVRFEVIDEGHGPAIDDIFTGDYEAGAPDPLKEAMKDIANQHTSQPAY